MTATKKVRSENTHRNHGIYGFYVACSDDSDQTVIVLDGTPQKTAKRLIHKNLKIKHVAPGIDVEIEHGEIVGIQLYDASEQSVEYPYGKIGKRQLKQLQKVANVLGPTMNGLQERVEKLAKAA